MKRKNKRDVISCILYGTVVVLLFFGLLRGKLFPVEISQGENRYAVQLPRLALGDFLCGSYQSQMERALGDQVGLASPGKAIYNNGISAYLNSMLQPMIQSGYFDGRYIDTRGATIFGDYYLLERPNYRVDQTALMQRAEELNRRQASDPARTYYVYYIERPSEINFETGEKLGYSDYFMELLDFPKDRTGIFRVDSFDEYKEKFYRTDHHWNYKGIHEAYLDVLHMMCPQEVPLSIQDEIELEGEYAGWNSIGDMSVVREKFRYYSYDFPPVKTTINGEAVPAYGSNTLDPQVVPSGIYTVFYGGDYAEVVFDREKPERENLLVFSNSFDNGVLRLLSSHFNKTYSVDPRHYEKSMGEPFVLESYLQEHEIDRVLFLGCVEFYTGEAFSIGGENSGI